MPLPTHLGPEYKLEKPDPQWHGDSGPIVKAYSTHFATLHVPFIDALEKLGVPRNTEPVIHLLRSLLNRSHPSSAQNKGDNVGATTVYCSVDSRTVTRSYAGKVRVYHLAQCYRETAYR